MNLYTHKVAWDDDQTQKLILKLDWLGTEAKPHFLCSAELFQHPKTVPESTTLFLVSGLYSTECIQIVARLGRALILEAAANGLDAVLARVRELAEAWREAGAHMILGQVTGLELDRIRKNHR